MHPAPGLLAQILDLLAGNRPPPRPAGPRPPLELLSKSEVRVLRYLPTHLSAPEIAAARASSGAGESLAALRMATSAAGL